MIDEDTTSQAAESDGPCKAFTGRTCDREAAMTLTTLTEACIERAVLGEDAGVNGPRHLAQCFALIAL